MPCRVDLRPLLSEPNAVAMLALARGQLNRAFRSHGLISPDPLTHGEPGHVYIDPAELDDPAAGGIDYARAKYAGVFSAWSEAMPAKLVGPVLQILEQTQRSLVQQHGECHDAVLAVAKARAFLLQLPDA